MKKRSIARPGCDPADHQHPAVPALRPAKAIARASGMLRAAGDPARLRLLEVLSSGERCVSDLVAVTGDPMPAVSQRLGRLRTEGLVVSRRDGKHIHYALADGHVASLLLAVLDHADHASARTP